MKHMKGVEPIEPEAPTKRYVLFDHPIIALVAMMLLYLAVGTLITVGIRMAGLTFTGMNERLVNAGVLVVSALITTLVFQLRFRSTFDGMFEWSGVGLLLVLPSLLFVVQNLYDFDAMQFNFLAPDVKMNPILTCLALAASPGITEELMFRGMPGANWMRVAKDGGDVMTCAIVTSVIFGVVHGANILAGAPIGATIFQVCYAASLGLFFAAVYLRTASVWPTIIAHTLIDFVAFLFMDLSKGGVLTEELVINMDFFITCGLAVLALLLGLIMLRRSKREQILQLWHRKWHQSGVVEQSRFRY